MQELSDKVIDLWFARFNEGLAVTIDTGEGNIHDWSTVPSVKHAVVFFKLHNKTIRQIGICSPEGF